MSRSIVDHFLNETEPLTARLDIISVLDDETCARLLDWFPENTRIGRYLREVLVTEGAVVDALCVLLWEGRGATRHAAAARLGELGDPDALPELIALLGRQLAARGEPTLLRTLIESIYACWIPGAPEAPRALVEALTAKSPPVRRAAATALRRMGDDARIVGQRLVELLEHRDEHVRFEAAELLPELTPPSVYGPQMTRLLRDEPDMLVRWIAHYETERLNAQARARITAA